MKIAIITPGYPPDVGGVERVVAAHARELARRGHDVAVITMFRRGVEVVTQGADSTVGVRRFGCGRLRGPFAFSLTLFAYVLARSRRFDVVHVHNAHSSVALSTLFVARRRLVFSPHFHGVGHSRVARLLHIPYRLLLRPVLTRPDVRICVSNSERDLMLSRYNIDGQKTVVIPNGVAADEIQKAQPYELRRKVLLSSSRLETYKQVDKVVQVVAALPDSWMLVVCGTGPQREDLVRIANSLRLGDRVAFLGHVSDGDLWRWLRTADVFVSLSKHEAYGLSLAEALVAGARAVVSDIPAYRELANGDQRVEHVAVDASPTAIAAGVERVSQRSSSAEYTACTVSWPEVALRLERVYAAVSKF